MWPAWCCALRSAARWSPTESAMGGPSTGPRAGSARSASRSRGSRPPRARSGREAGGRRSPPGGGVGAGAALIAGAGTPLAASAVVGTMAVAARSVHVKNGFFITGEGYEYVLNLSAASVALAVIGPGRLSVDRLLGIDSKLTPAQPAGLAAGLGLAAASVQLAAFWQRPKPSQAPAQAPAQASVEQ